jgi:hypothetical protein
MMTRPAATGLFVGAMVALLVGTQAAASAKGAEEVRGYAVVTGPGLAHPIVFTAPWDRSKGGYYSLEAEDLVNFATFAGGIPGYVRPAAQAPELASLGPGYEVIFFRDCCRLSVHQVVYPFAQGRPWVYTPPGQDQPCGGSSAASGEAGHRPDGHRPTRVSWSCSNNAGCLTSSRALPDGRKLSLRRGRAFRGC